MRIKEGFFLQKIEGVDMLLPYGNRIASFAHGMQLGGCGTFLAELLLEGKDYSREELLSAMVSEYGTEVPQEQLAEDLDGFLKSLGQTDVLDGSVDGHCFYDGPTACFSIAGIGVSFVGPEALVHPYLAAFASEDVASDLTIRVAGYHRNPYEIGNILVRSEDVVAYENATAYGVLYPENQFLRVLFHCLFGPE